MKESGGGGGGRGGEGRGAVALRKTCEPNLEPTAWEREIHYIHNVKYAYQ